MAPDRPAARPLTADIARQLAVVCQGLAAAPVVPAPRPAGGRVCREDVVRLVEHLGYVQLDPISVVERSPLLVLWSRLGPFDRALLDEALFERRELLEYWAHAAAIVPSSALALHRWRMARMTTGSTTWERRTREFLERCASLREEVLARLETDGPLPAQAFGYPAPPDWRSRGWSDESDVGRLLDVLWLQGVVVVAGRSGGGRRTYELADRWWLGTPAAADGTGEPSEEEVVRQRVVGTLRAHGVVTARQLAAPLGAAGRRAAAAALAGLATSGEVVPVQVTAGAGGPGGRRGAAVGTAVPAGDWYVHVEDLPLVTALEEGAFVGRTVLLSPFDNLVIDRDRTEKLFGFEYRIEIYTPKAARRFGYYVMPVLQGDRLVGRVDAASDRRRGVLRVLAVYAEPAAPRGAPQARAVRLAVEELARCCGLEGVELAVGAVRRGAPLAWQRQLTRWPAAVSTGDFASGRRTGRTRLADR